MTERYDSDNIFARILRGEAPAHRVYEDDGTLAFLDIMPQADGHTLVIPKTAARDLFDLPAQEAARLMVATQKLARAVDEAFRPAGIMIAQLNRAGAGQSVFHVHFHILPRYHGIDLELHARRRADTAQLERHAEMIRARLWKREHVLPGGQV